MKKLRFLLLPLLIIISSCYIYKPYQAKDADEVAANSSPSKFGAVSLRDEKGVVNKPVNPKEEAEKKQKSDAAMKEEIEKNNKKSKEGKATLESEGKGKTQSFSKNLDPELSEKNAKLEKATGGEGVSETDSLKIKIGNLDRRFQHKRVRIIKVSIF